MSSILTVTSAATARALVNIEHLKLELGISDDAGTATLQRLILGASSVIEGWCGRVFARETVQEVFRPDCVGECFNLARYPVASITSVVADGVTLTADGYELDAAAGQLWRLFADHRIGWWARKLTVVYVAGYLLPNDIACTLPAAISRSCITMVTSYYQSQGRDLSVRSETAQDVGQTSWLDPRPGMEALLPQVAGMLEPYRAFA